MTSYNTPVAQVSLLSLSLVLICCTAASVFYVSFFSGASVLLCASIMKRTGLVLLLLSGFVSLCRPLPEFIISREFHVVGFSATWTAAQTHCRQHYTDLATIEDLASNTEVRDKVGGGTYWIGLHQVPWKWSGSGQEAVVDSGWYQSSDTGRCVSMSRTGRWHLEDCYSLRPFSCYSATVNRHILHLQPMNFYDAQSYCRYNYTDLSTTMTHEDHNEVRGLLRSNTNTSVAWIGLERYAWTWSDGSNSPFSFWTNGRPVGQDLCGTISSTTWGSQVCNGTNHFICHQDVQESALRSVKVRVRGGSADLSNPTVQQSILQQLQQKLKDQGVTGEVKLWWNKQPDGEVFHREEEVRGHCEDGDAV